MADSQIRLIPSEAVAQMSAIGHRIDGIREQVSATSAGIDSRVLAAVEQQVQASRQAVTAAVETSTKSATAASALEDQDKANRAKVDGVKSDIATSTGAGRSAGPRLPQDKGPGTFGAEWKPGDRRHRPFLAGPGGLGPPVTPDQPWIEIGPRSGIFVPENELPGVQVLGPGALGPPVNPHNPYIELIPGSGVWAPQADFPGATFLPPGSLGPSTSTGTGAPALTEFLPGSGIWIPSQQLRP